MVQTRKNRTAHKLLSEAVAEQKNECPLFSLPLELRQMCYELVEPQDLLNVVLVNKQTHVESRPLLYKRCTFNITVSQYNVMRDLIKRYEHASQCIRQLPSDISSLPKIQLQTPCALERAPKARALRALKAFKKVIQSLIARNLSLPELTIYLCLPERSLGFAENLFPTRSTYREILSRLKASLALGARIAKRTNLILCYGEQGAERMFDGRGPTTVILAHLLDTRSNVENLRLWITQRCEHMEPPFKEYKLSYTATDIRRKWLDQLIQIRESRGVAIEAYADYRDVKLPNQALEPPIIGGLEPFVDPKVVEAANEREREIWLSEKNRRKTIEESLRRDYGITSIDNDLII